MINNEAISAMALSMMFPHRQVGLRQLYDRAGSAANIVENASRLHQILPDLNPRTFNIDPADMIHFIQMAKSEALYLEDHEIQCIPLNSPLYPTRLREVCPDAPIVLYYKGTVSLNSPHIISIVGTRNSTEYGRDMTDNLISELAAACPDLIVVSGLAYGTDINAHRAALNNKVATIGVLAHGLDRVYPSRHNYEAQRMILSGGLLTEFPHNTPPETYHFLQRNRIIAALAQGTIVVESKEKGGSLNTAQLALDYNLSVMACPGRANEPYSAGCNKLIRNQTATLITSATDVIETLGWTQPKTILQPQPTLFDDDLSGEERHLMQYINTEGRHISLIAAESGISIPTLMSLLPELEFRGLLRQLPGAKWRKV